MGFKQTGGNYVLERGAIVNTLFMSKFSNICKPVFILSFCIIGFSFDAFGNDNMSSTASNESDAQISVDRECMVSRNHLVIYPGGLNNDLLGTYNNWPLYYKDYLLDIYSKISENAPDLEISFSGDSEESNAGFFPENYNTPGQIMTTFFSLGLFFRKERPEMKKLISEVSDDHTAWYRKYNDEYFATRQDVYTGDAYCKKLKSSDGKTAYVFFPLSYKSNTHISGKDCIRINVLDSLCFKVAGQPKYIKKLMNKIFLSGEDGKDKISDFGKNTFRQLLQNTEN